MGDVAKRILAGMFKGAGSQAMAQGVYQGFNPSAPPPDPKLIAAQTEEAMAKARFWTSYAEQLGQTMSPYPPAPDAATDAPVETGPRPRRGLDYAAQPPAYRPMESNGAGAYDPGALRRAFGIMNLGRLLRPEQVPR